MIPHATNSLPEIKGLDNEDISSLLDTKTYKQYCRYINDRLKGICPFCDPLDTELNKVIQEIPCRDSDDGVWRMWENPFPAKHAEKHLTIAPSKHIVHPDQMTSDDYDLCMSLIMYAISSPDGIGMGLPGGGVLWRWGDPERNAGSIRHMHINIIVPDGTGEVRPPLAKKPADVAKKKKIVRVWEKLRLEGLSPEDARDFAQSGRVLTPDEFALVEKRLV